MHGNFRLALFANSPWDATVRRPTELVILELCLETSWIDLLLLEQPDLEGHLADPS
jgi:hypothetical protein